MWAYAQRDGCPGNIGGAASVENDEERKFHNSIPCTSPQSLAHVHCSSACSIGECKTWTQIEFCTWQISVRQQEPPKTIYSVPAQKTAKHCAKFG